MPKPDPSTWAPTRPGQYWSYSVLKEKIEEFGTWWIANGKGEAPVWEFWLDRNLEDGQGNPAIQTLTITEFNGEVGDGRKWPVPGIYYADCKVNGQSVLRQPWQGIHFDEDARAEKQGRETSDQALARSISDQFTRLHIEIADLRRERAGDEQRAKKLRRENQEYVDALAEKDREILSLKRERDAALNAKEEAEFKMEAAIEEKLALQDSLESLREPLRMVGAGFVEEAARAIGLPEMPRDASGSENLPEAVRAAAERITLAVLRCPDAQEVLDLSSDPETGRRFWGPDDNPIDFLIAFFQDVQATEAAQAAQAAQAGHASAADACGADAQQGMPA